MFENKKIKTLKVVYTTGHWPILFFITKFMTITKHLQTVLDHK